MISTVCFDPSADLTAEKIKHANDYKKELYFHAGPILLSNPRGLCNDRTPTCLDHQLVLILLNTTASCNIRPLQPCGLF